MSETALISSFFLFGYIKKMEQIRGEVRFLNDFQEAQSIEFIFNTDTLVIVVIFR